MYRWPACAELGIAEGLRAFHGKPRSVRTKGQMRSMRAKITEKANAYLRTPASYKKPIPELIGKVYVTDLAFEL